MKKNIKIIFVNIIIFSLILIISSIFINKSIDNINNFYVNYHGSIDPSKIDINNYSTEEFTGKRIENNRKTYQQFCGDDRQVFGINYTKKPIVILGCSYAYGHGLKREESFPYEISRLTKRPVYNFALCGDNAIESLKVLKRFADDNKYNGEKIKNAEYVIYVYMHDHIDRYLRVNFIYEYYNKIYPPRYKLVKKLISIPAIRFICTIFQIQKIIAGGNDNIKNYNKFLNNSEQHLKHIMLTMHDEIRQYSPNAKIIIILYDQKIARLYDNLKIKYDTDIQNSQIWDEINNQTDMTVIHSKDITGFLFDKNYKLEADIADWHPNARAWQVFTPKFAKKYIN